MTFESDYKSLRAFDLEKNTFLTQRYVNASAGHVREKHGETHLR
jgi:hypothetical protein